MYSPLSFVLSVVFLALPCCVHWIPSNTLTTLHVSSWRGWHSPCGRWKREILNDSFFVIWWVQNIPNINLDVVCVMKLFMKYRGFWIWSLGKVLRHKKFISPIAASCHWVSAQQIWELDYLLDCFIMSHIWWRISFFCCSLFNAISGWISRRKFQRGYECVKRFWGCC